MCLLWSIWKAPVKIRQGKHASLSVPIFYYASNKDLMPGIWQSDIQHNGIQHNDIKHYDILHNGIQHIDIKHNDIQHNGIQHNDTQHNDCLLYTSTLPTNREV